MATLFRMNVSHVFVWKRRVLCFGCFMRNQSGRYETFRQLMVLHLHWPCNEIKISFEIAIQQEVVYNWYCENCVRTARGRSVDPRCDGNIVELYCDLLEGEGESGRNVVYPWCKVFTNVCSFTWPRGCAPLIQLVVRYHFTFTGPRIVIYSYNKIQRDALFVSNLFW